MVKPGGAAQGRSGCDAPTIDTTEPVNAMELTTVRFSSLSLISDATLRQKPRSAIADAQAPREQLAAGLGENGRILLGEGRELLQVDDAGLIEKTMRKTPFATLRIHASVEHTSNQRRGRHSPDSVGIQRTFPRCPSRAAGPFPQMGGRPSARESHRILNQNFTAQRDSNWSMHVLTWSSAGRQAAT